MASNVMDCDYCGAGFTDLPQLLDHEEAHHVAGNEPLTVLTFVPSPVRNDEELAQCLPSYLKELATFMDTMKLFRSKGEDKDALASYREKMKPIEKALSERGDYFGGDKVGMVDLIFWPWFERIPAQQKITNLDQLPNDMFPKLNAWRTRMLEVEAVKETICDPETQYQFYMSNAEGTPNYDLGLD